MAAAAAFHESAVEAVPNREVQNAGVSNSRLWLEGNGDQKLVVRAYDWMYVAIMQDDWQNAVDASAAVGLVHSPDTWSYEALEEEVIVRNGFLHIVDPSEVRRGTLYAAYEEALQQLMTLWEEHGWILADLHDKNLVVSLVGEEIRLLICDGKCAGATRCSSAGCRRLQTKLYYNADVMHEYHVWLLEAYLRFLGGGVDKVWGA